MAMPWSVTVVHAGLSGAFDKTVPRIPSIGAHWYASAATRLQRRRDVGIPLCLSHRLSLSFYPLLKPLSLILSLLTPAHTLSAARSVPCCALCLHSLSRPVRPS